MALFNRKNPEDRTTAARQLVISYKKFFGSTEGKEVFADLANHFRFLDDGDAASETQIIKKYGQDSVIRYILKQAHMDMAQFELLLEGKL